MSFLKPHGHYTEESGFEVRSANVGTRSTMVCGQVEDNFLSRYKKCAHLSEGPGKLT